MNRAVQHATEEDVVDAEGQVEQRLSALREDIKSLGVEIRKEINSLRAEVREELASVRRDIAALRADGLKLGLGIGALVATVAALT